MPTPNEEAFLRGYYQPTIDMLRTNKRGEMKLGDIEIVYADIPGGMKVGLAKEIYNALLDPKAEGVVETIKNLCDRIDAMNQSLGANDDEEQEEEIGGDGTYVSIKGFF